MAAEPEQRMVDDRLHLKLFHGTRATAQLSLLSLRGAAGDRALISFAARMTLRIPAATPSTTNTIKSHGLVWMPKRPREPVHPHPITRHPTTPAQEFGREPEPYLRLAGRSAPRACRTLGLEVVEPPAEIVQPVGVWSRQNRLPKVPKNRTKPAFGATEGGRTIWPPPFGRQERQAVTSN